MPTCARPLDSARFAPFWSGKTSTFTAALPAALHFLPCAVASAACVVPFSTATVRPQRSARVLIVGPPLAFTKNEVPAEKYVTKSTTFSRSLVSVNEDIPRSYLREARPGMMLSKVALTMLTLRPITPARAFARSASMPTTERPFGPMNSFGAYVASAATLSVPLDLMAEGTSAATFLSTLTAPPPLGGVVFFLPPPQPATTMLALARRASAMANRGALGAVGVISWERASAT